MDVDHYINRNGKTGFWSNDWAILGDWTPGRIFNKADIEQLLIDRKG